MDFQSENMDTSNQDDEFEIDDETQVGETPATQVAIPQRKRRRTSTVWADFVLVGLGRDGKERAKCIHCGLSLVIACVASKKSLGTNHLRRHLDVCPKMPKKIEGHVYDHMVDRLMVTEAIIYHDLPFKYVEYEKVRERDRYLNLNCQPICRQTAALDVYRRYELEKETLKEQLANHHGRVCFTSDLWLARPQNTGYICLSAHYIDASWRLNAKILTFCELKSPHTGDEIANKIFESLKEWGLQKKVFAITLDNATNNTSMLRILKGKLQMTSGIGLLCDGKYMHIRCCAHILNLIVKKGLELANSLLHNIRESVRYVKASPQRKDAFAACIEREGIKSGAGLSLDVPTRWNSTYEMLPRALKFRKAFESLELYDANYKSLPSEDEWNRGEKICEFLKPFSVITTHFSGSKYPTVNIYFQQVWRIQLLLRKYSYCDDDSLRKMAKDMKINKFDKYWEEYSLILSMGVVFDPRVKLEMLEAAYDELDPFTSASKIEELRKNLKSLYEDYQIQSQTSSSNVSGEPTPLELITESPLDDDYEFDFFRLEKNIAGGAANTKTHLDTYLDEQRLARSSYPEMDVLGYWRDNQDRFGYLALVARDILSIPITTVASESAFSIGSRVITPYRSRLLPKNVQALLCTRNWLRGFPEYEGNIEDNFDNDDEDVRRTSTSSGVECSTSRSQHSMVLR